MERARDTVIDFLETEGVARGEEIVKQLLGIDVGSTVRD